MNHLLSILREMGELTPVIENLLEASPYEFDIECAKRSCVKERYYVGYFIIIGGGKMSIAYTNPYTSQSEAMSGFQHRFSMVPRGFHHEIFKDGSKYFASVNVAVSGNTACGKVEGDPIIAQQAIWIAVKEGLLKAEDVPDGYSPERLLKL